MCNSIMSNLSIFFFEPTSNSIEKQIHEMRNGKFVSETRFEFRLESLYSIRGNIQENIRGKYHEC